jgi:hypothetical protein
VTVLAGLVGMVGVLLAAGGVSKGRQPTSTVASFRAVGLPASRGAVRALAVVEVLLGGELIAIGGRLPTALGALLFAGFALVTVRLVRMGGEGASCGCFGDRSARPSVVHVAVDAGAAAVLAVATALGSPGLVTHWSTLPGRGFVVLGLMATGGYLLVALMTVFADALSAISDHAAPAASEFGLRP